MIEDDGRVVPRIIQEEYLIEEQIIKICQTNDDKEAGNENWVKQTALKPVYMKK